MRKIVVHEFITLDGIIQSPGAPLEDPSGGFESGGWIAPYSDDSSGAIMKRLTEPADLLLGRKTFAIWEAYWPERASKWSGINDVTKYVLSKTLKESTWNNTVFLNNVDDVKKLKTSSGTDIKLWGSSEIVRLLLAHDLVDELWLLTHPIVLGKGKKLFAEGIIPAAFILTEHFVTTTGVIIGNYKRSGEVKKGVIGD